MKTAFKNICFHTFKILVMTKRPTVLLHATFIY